MGHFIKSKSFLKNVNNFPTDSLEMILFEKKVTYKEQIANGCSCKFFQMAHFNMQQVTVYHFASLLVWFVLAASY